MKQDTFEEEVFIQSDVASVIELIADYSQHHKIHPLIVHVEKGADPDPGVKRYHHRPVAVGTLPLQDQVPSRHPVRY